MIRKLSELHLDKIADAANKGQLTSVKIYKADSGKNRGVHMVEYEIDKDHISNAPSNKEAHGQLIKALREIRGYLSSGDYDVINLDYSTNSKMVFFRIVGKKKI